MRIIILDGPDGAGKTTLVQQLEASITNSMAIDGIDAIVDTWHFGPIPEERTALEEYLLPLMQWVDDHRANSEKSVLIIDRFALGELIYGPVFRGASRLTWDDYKTINRYLTEIGATRIYVRTPYEVCAERVFSSRGDEMVTSTSQLKDVWEQYEGHLESSPDWVIWTPEHSAMLGWEA